MRLRRVAATVAAAVVVLLAAAPGQASLADDAVELGGTPVPGGTGSTDPTNPTELTAGVWLDELGPDLAHNTRYYEYTRTTEGEETSTVLVGAMTTGIPSTSDSINLDVTTSADASCAGESASRSSSGLWPFGVSVFAGSQDGESFAGECVEDRTLKIKVTHNNVGEKPVPVAIKIVEEARVQSTIEDLPPGVKSGTTVPTPKVSGEAEPLAGGTSLTEAPELTNGRFTTTLIEGGVQVWKVPLDWDQNLIVRARIPKVEPEDETSSVYGPTVDLSVLSPMGETTSSLYEDEATSESVDEEESVELIHATGPVRLRPRYDDSYGVTTPGDFYVVLGATTLDETDRELRKLPVTLDVEVRGKPGKAPSYFKEKPYLVAPGERKDVASGTGVSKAEQEALDAKRTQKIIAATALALVGLVATGGGLTLLRRR